jgi:hypothetical protein
MFLIPKVAMLIDGIWALVSGRVPSILVGGDRRDAEQAAAQRDKRRRELERKAHVWGHI